MRDSKLIELIKVDPLGQKAKNSRYGSRVVNEIIVNTRLLGKKNSATVPLRRKRRTNLLNNRPEVDLADLHSCWFSFVFR